MDLRFRIDEIDRNDSLDTWDVLRLLKENDPSKKYVEIIFPFFWENNGIWSSEECEEVGRAIARNTNLQKLSLDWSKTSTNPFEHSQVLSQDEDLTERTLLRFLELMSDNRHIWSFHLRSHECGHFQKFVMGVLQRMENFFEENDNLQVLHLNHEMDSKSLPFLMKTLSRRSNSLEKLELDEYCKIGDDEISEMTSFFARYPAMTPRRISLRNNHIGDEGCVALSEMIKNIDICLEEIDVSGSKNIGPSGVKAIACSLAGRKLALDSFDFSRNTNVGNIGLLDFFIPFSSNLEMVPNKLNLVGNLINSSGLAILSHYLSKRNSPLDTLNLECNHVFNYEGFDLLVDALMEKPSITPRILSIDENCLGHNGYFRISGLLRNQDCTLEKLRVFCALTISKEEFADLSASLEVNRTLKELIVCTNDVEEDGWDLLASTLCDRTSIQSTYFSNHTLIQFGNAPIDHQTGDYLDHDISWYLEMNKHPDKKVVACHKVINYHFARNFQLNTFEEMRPPS